MSGNNKTVEAGLCKFVAVSQPMDCSQPYPADEGLSMPIQSINMSALPAATQNRLARMNGICDTIMVRYRYFLLLLIESENIVGLSTFVVIR